VTLGERMRQQVGAWPRKGVRGVEGPWLEVGELDVPTGALCALDPMIFNAEDGLTLHVEPGTYVVEGRVMDFEGHLRVSRMRAYLKGSIPRPAERIGETGTDSARVAICDIEDVFDGYDDSLDDQFEEARWNFGTEGGDIITLYAGPHVMQFAVCESGLGDGMFGVFALRDAGKAVGMDVEFLPRDFIMR
jgi:hypothetical protein